MTVKNNTTYFLAFIHPISKQYVFLAKNADIKSICYSTYPKLLGTIVPDYAKIYSSIEAAKSDIYLLRYYHRCFLSILCAIIPTSIVNNCRIDNSDIIVEYDALDFVEPVRINEINFFIEQ